MMMTRPSLLAYPLVVVGLLAGSVQAAGTQGAVVQTPPPVSALPQQTAPSAAPASPPPVMLAPASVDAGAEALPSMNFYSSVAADELLTRLKAAPAFARVEKELYGSPIQVRVTHALQPTAGGQAAGLLSAIWAGSTLGLLPVVTNNNLVLTYEIKVNGKEIARYEFSRSFTRAINIWSEKNDPTYGLGEEGIEWVRTTVDEFAAKAATEPAVLELAKEHQFYFGAGNT